MTQASLHLATTRALAVAVVAVGAFCGLNWPAAAFPGEQIQTGSTRTIADEGGDAYGAPARPGHPGSVGLYDCGPGGKATRLSKQACGGSDRFGHLSRE